ncbi:hypothetical protein P7K49_037622 [Saguinus oedipus]|uniref:Uncharacterized protein n=1 Tax=Saguinus oedipus TaxID=9490 RepID=A0ABQ9TIL6_SAGOE|nr:hypothetical protein P7K49_037622 [Saguinus oedipus]
MRRKHTPRGLRAVQYSTVITDFKRALLLGRESQPCKTDQADRERLSGQATRQDSRGLASWAWAAQLRVPSTAGPEPADIPKEEAPGNQQPRPRSPLSPLSRSPVLKAAAAQLDRRLDFRQEGGRVQQTRLRGPSECNNTGKLSGFSCVQGSIWTHLKNHWLLK